MGTLTPPLLLQAQYCGEYPEHNSTLSHYNMNAVLLILVAVVVICEANPQSHLGGSGGSDDKRFCVTSIMSPASRRADAIREAAQVRVKTIVEAAEASAGAVIDAARKSSETC